MTKLERLIMRLDFMISQHDNNRMKRRVICYKDNIEYSFDSAKLLCDSLDIKLTAFNNYINLERSTNPKELNGYSGFDVIFEVKK